MNHTEEEKLGGKIHNILNHTIKRVLTYKEYKKLIETINKLLQAVENTQREEILAKVDRIPVPHLYVNGEMIPDSNFLSDRELIKQSLKEEGK